MITTYLRLRMRKGGAEYLLKKDKKNKLLSIEIKEDPYDTVSLA